VNKILILVIGLISIVFLNSCSSREKISWEFEKAVPVWPAGLEYEKNLTVGYRAQFDSPDSGLASLKLTGSSLYRIYLNGKFVGHGPARAGHGYYRVDEWDLSGELEEGNNFLAIEVAGYNINSYYLLDQPSFLQAEVVSGNEILVATSDRNEDFEAIHLSGRIQKVPRYSFQRTFMECYRIESGWSDWKEPDNLSQEKAQSLNLEQVEKKQLLPRRVPYPEFNTRNPVTILSQGTTRAGIKREHYWRDRAVVDIGEKLGGFKEEELVLNPAVNLQEMDSKTEVMEPVVYNEKETMDFSDGQFRIFDLGTNLSGFIGGRIEVVKEGRIYITFDEILSDQDIDFKRLACINAVTYYLSPGTYNLETIEPYTLRYLKILMVGGESKISNIYLREYVNPDIDKASFECSDPRLNRIYRAGVETFRQNAVDVFMDCPSRERAGWLCDSYFTSRVAADLSGNTIIEKNFYENFMLPDSFEFLPEGMLPMCYPADHNDSVFIPNWAMWFVVQLQEYLYRSGDRAMVDALRPKVMALIDYFEPFKNEDGLLEKLDSWIFVEWSDANRFVQDVNYPTNMLFAATLDAAGDLYQLDSLKKEAAEIRETIRMQSFNGNFFVDNAVRNEQGELVVMNNTSEVCQYFAFYFGIADPDHYPELWDKLVNEFGPARKETNLHPEVYFANSFVGNYLRLELLSQNNLVSQLLAESIDFFDYMANSTGTLWEHISPYASCNHGFASHVVHVLYRDVLGISDINTREKEIILRISDINLESCKGQVPLENGLFEFKWERDEETIFIEYGSPPEYNIVLQNNTNLKIVEKVQGKDL